MAKKEDSDFTLDRRGIIKTATAGIVSSGILPGIAQAQAQEITAGETITGSISSATDVDEYELSVNQGDVIDVTFEKGSRNLTKFEGSGSGGFVSLGGLNSEGKEQITGRTTITQTGAFEIDVSTLDSEVNGQDYTFTANVNSNADKWPSTEPAEITAGETISGTIHTTDDRDTFELLVDQGDVVDVTFEKGSRNLTKFEGSGSGGFVSLGGLNSEGKEQITGRTTITQTGAFEIDVSTLDSEVNGQDYTFTANVNSNADKWPSTEPAEITAGETISGTIHTTDDRDTFELLVDQGDVVDVTFEKGSQNLTKFEGSGSGGFVSLGGLNSEGKEQANGQATITQTGTFEIDISTLDSGVDGQDYRFVINGDLETGTKTLTVSISPTSVTVDTPTEVTVTVSDESGSPVPNASIEIADLGLSSTTDSNGEATLSINASSTGDYDVSVSAENYTGATETLTVTEQDQLTARFGGEDNEIGNLDVLEAVNAANNGSEIGGEPVSNLDILQLVNRLT
jgi:hypothetical protein